MTVPPASRYSILGRLETTANWTGTGLSLAVHDGASMAQTPNGSMIFSFQNQSPMNNQGKLALTSGGSAPNFYAAPALAGQPQILTHNWQANNLNVTNVSANSDTPIWIEAYGPGIGTPPQTLPIGSAVPIAPSGTLEGLTNPNWMQLIFQFNSSQLAVFGFIGGPQDASGNNAYVVAVNSRSGDTGPGTGKPAPPGYFATVAGNTYSYEFNWGASKLFVAYFGSANVIPPMFAEIMPTVEVKPAVTLLSF